MVSPRSHLLASLRDASLFEVPEDVLRACLESPPLLAPTNERRIVVEAAARATVLGGVPIPAAVRSSVLPVLGNVAEAVVETLLADLGWMPVLDDDAASSSGHGVDLLMLDPALARLFAVEVKSTVQSGRWPRLASGRNEQLTPEWFDSPGNKGMAQWDVRADDVYTMVVQVHLRRRLWRACVARDPCSPHPVTELAQLSDLDWLARP